MKAKLLLLLMLTALVSFAVTALIGKKMVPWLHKLKFGQTIRADGPSWHQQKQGTPTMGGLMFILGGMLLAIVGTVAYQLVQHRPVLHNVRLISGWIMAMLCGMIGFADDYIKVVKKRNLGLTSQQKMLAQIMVAAAFAFTYYLAGQTAVYVPFVGNVDFHFWFIPFAMFIVVGVMNATNLTDGIDGLCGSITFVVCLFFLSMAGVHGFMAQSITAASMAGALAGFLVWNLHPARVFMGDTGSLFVGGFLCALAFGIGQPFLLVPAGIVYIVETLSVILQVGYFKLTHGKRLFKMSPIHHHFELCGWGENKIVFIFSAVTLVGCVLGMLFFSDPV